MKNKLYYVLIPVYVLTVIFILYINGVFTGTVLSTVNLLINVGFLGIIGVLFFISLKSFTNLNRCTDELVTKTKQLQEESNQTAGKNLWTKYQARKDVFSDKELNAAFEKYQLRMKNYQTKRGYKAVCDIDEYINEDLLDRVGKTFYNSGMSGTLTGLGILGTFLGLSMGLASFNGNNLFTISDNVGPLLDGMKVAFHTSVYGIFFSLIFGFIYRSIMSDAYEKLENFQNAFRQYAAPVSAAKDENEAAMVIYQAGMANTMKQILELLKGTSAEQTKGLEQIVNQFTEQMAVSMGNNFKELGNTLTYITDAQTTAVHNNKELLETVETLITVNRGMQEAMTAMLKKQEEFSKELKIQKEELTNVCDQISNEVSTQLYAFDRMRDLYER